MAARIVRVRSAAEIPVVTPSRASIDSQNAVPKFEVLCGDISGSRRSSQRSGVSVRQIRPRPCVAMKLMISGVTFSAAMVRSPSFSRSSSSTTTSMRPARISSMASGMDAEWHSWRGNSTIALRRAICRTGDHDDNQCSPSPRQCRSLRSSSLFLRCAALLPDGRLCLAVVRRLTPRRRNSRRAFHAPGGDPNDRQRRVSR